MDIPVAAPAEPLHGTRTCGLVLFLGSGSEEAAWPARAVLGAADAILHDGMVAAPSLAVIPQRVFVETIAAGQGGGRAKKLAAEGWHVVRLVAGDPAGSPALLREAEELVAAGITIRFFAGPRAPADPLPVPVPQPFATALNGLAG
ncbi:MAG: hypothetical protein ACREFK_16455 [Stellaceae bacterium]